MFMRYLYIKQNKKKSRSTPAKSHVLGEKSAAVVQPCTRRIVQGSLKKDQHGRITRVRVSPATKKTRSRRPSRSSLALAVGRWLVAVRPAVRTQLQFLLFQAGGWHGTARARPPHGHAYARATASGQPSADDATYSRAILS
jgi:hypothetical protein